MRVTWFYKLRVDDQGTAWISMWTAEGDTFVQSSASMRIGYVLNDRDWDGGMELGSSSTWVLARLRQQGGI